MARMEREKTHIMYNENADKLLDELFSYHKKPNNKDLPWSHRNLPQSFYHEPTTLLKVSHAKTHSSPDSSSSSSYMCENSPAAMIRPVQLSFEYKELPAPFQMAVDDDNRVYFLNHETKTTTWFDPRLPNHYQSTGMSPEVLENAHRAYYNEMVKCETVTHRRSTSLTSSSFKPPLGPQHVRSESGGNSVHFNNNNNNISSNNNTTATPANITTTTPHNNCVNTKPPMHHHNRSSSNPVAMTPFLHHRMHVMPQHQSGDTTSSNTSVDSSGLRRLGGQLAVHHKKMNSLGGHEDQQASPMVMFNNARSSSSGHLVEGLHDLRINRSDNSPAALPSSNVMLSGLDDFLMLGPATQSGNSLHHHHQHLQHQQQHHHHQHQSSLDGSATASNTQQQQQHQTQNNHTAGPSGTALLPNHMEDFYQFLDPNDTGTFTCDDLLRNVELDEFTD